MIKELSITANASLTAFDIAEHYQKTVKKIVKRKDTCKRQVDIQETDVTSIQVSREEIRYIWVRGEFSCRRTNGGLT